MRKTFQIETINKLIVGKNSIKEINNIIGDYNNVLVITSKGRLKAGFIKKLKQNINNKIKCFDVYSKINSEPTKEMIFSCYEYVKDTSYDLIIGLGGGSCIDTAKIISILQKNNLNEKDFKNENILRKGADILAIPTTAGSGSEATNIAVFKDENNKKKAIVNSFLIPKYVIIDPFFLTTIPKKIAAYTGIDALTHCIESFTSKKSNFITKEISLKGFKLIIENLIAFKENNDFNIRLNLGLGSFFGGVADMNAGVGGVHALAYPLENLFNIPHGLANSLILPYVLKFNSKKQGIYDDMKKIVNFKENFYKFIYEYIRKLNLPTSLKEVNVRKSELKKLSKMAITYQRLLSNNPLKMNFKEIHNIYCNSLKGDLK